MGWIETEKYYIPQECFKHYHISKTYSWREIYTVVGEPEIIEGGDPDGKEA